MVKTLVIPGVSVEVLKEIVPQQLYPSGVVAMMGATEKGKPLLPEHVTNFREFAEKFGSSDAYPIVNDARQAFQNGVFEIVVVSLAGKGGEKASLTLKDRADNNTIQLIANVGGEAGNKIKVAVEPGTSPDSVKLTFGDIASVAEIWDDLVMDKRSEKNLVKFINSNSTMITAKDLKSNAKYPANNPLEVQTALSGGTTGVISKEDYEAALERLEAEAEVDVVSAPDVSDPAIHALIESHCMRMSLDAKNRIGIGTVARDEPVDDICKRTTNLASDRFVLVAPYGYAGAVAGLISRLNYYDSPTFKPLSGIAKIEPRTYLPSEQMKLLNNGILPLDAIKGRGIVIVKGITTSKEQISVMRIADHSVRGVNNIAYLFIGTLNNENGRTALRCTVEGFMRGMEREGSIVPSTDGTEPAFIVDVFSSQLDFGQGIVRVAMAVRPVRAMDYIYATIKVEA
jgi:hypothetical protein